MSTTCRAGAPVLAVFVAVDVGQRATVAGDIAFEPPRVAGEVREEVRVGARRDGRRVAMWTVPIRLCVVSGKQPSDRQQCMRHLWLEHTPNTQSVQLWTFARGGRQASARGKESCRVGSFGSTPRPILRAHQALGVALLDADRESREVPASHGHRAAHQPQAQAVGTCVCGARTPRLSKSGGTVHHTWRAASWRSDSKRAARKLREAGTLARQLRRSSPRHGLRAGLVHTKPESLVAFIAPWVNEVEKVGMVSSRVFHVLLGDDGWESLAPRLLAVGGVVLEARRSFEVLWVLALQSRDERRGVCKRLRGAQGCGGSALGMLACGHHARRGGELASGCCVLVRMAIAPQKHLRTLVHTYTPR